MDIPSQGQALVQTRNMWCQGTAGRRTGREEDSPGETLHLRPGRVYIQNKRSLLEQCYNEELTAVWRTTMTF